MLHALIAEDDPTSARILQSIVARYASVQVVGDGEQALIAYQSALDVGTPFDVIFLDILMPNADGQEALVAIRETETEQGVIPGCGVKVIMVTALDDAQNIYEAHRYGCMEYLTKPIDRKLVEHALQRLGVIPPAPRQAQ